MYIFPSICGNLGNYEKKIDNDAVLCKEQIQFGK